MSSSDRDAETRSKVSVEMVVAAWHGTTVPSGIMWTKRRAQPSMHARGNCPEVVRLHEEDVHRPAQPFFRGHRDVACAIELLARRQERVAVLERPAVELHVRELEAFGAEPFGERDDVGDLIEVPAVEDDVHRERQVELLHGARGSELLLPRVRVGDALRRLGVPALKAHLHVIEPHARRAPRSARDRRARRSSRGSCRGRARERARRAPRDRSARAARRR